MARELIDKGKLYDKVAFGTDLCDPCRDEMINLLDEQPAVNAVELPCKIGDEVWGLRLYRDARIPKNGVVHQMYFGEEMTLCICVKNVCRGQWGRNIFATREEAEAAIGGGSIHV